MSTLALTGSHGFLGWHVRSAARAAGHAIVRIAVGADHDARGAREAIATAERVLHIAGVNRGSDDEVRDGNLLFARQLADALHQVERAPREVVFANSVQAGNGSVYGSAKSEAADIVRAAAERAGATFRDVLLPNLFGEHGRPFYNSVVSTFSHVIAGGGAPTVEVDRELTLLHAQDAADVLLEPGIPLQSRTHVATVTALRDRLTEIADAYADGTIPDLSDRLNRDLFNTYRSFTFEGRPAIPLVRHADARGAFFEIVRARGGEGQSSFSTTVPGVTRGDHFHRRKVERFTVLAGRGRITLRRLFTDAVISIDVDGSEPVAVDMPTMWSHAITNTGDDTLYTSFWSNEIFDPDHPDTHPEKVDL
jgi:UDP-2-acetamido-2,6-beta-L-arabino-hexul-4-ose reductase